ncbi:MAG: FAD binding domain-containing protein [bacterium]|nr:FAD binding domain-containing protein [bacterium]
MLTNIKYYSCPQSINEAVRELTKGRGRYSILAGGTSSLIHTHPRCLGFVSLKDLGLGYIRQAKGMLRIGAMTRIQEILEDKRAGRLAGGLLYKACSCLGSTLNRSLITAGGNMTQIFRWSDFPVALLVLDTKITVAGPSRMTVPLIDLLKKHPKTKLKYNQIITEIGIRDPGKGYRSEFIKFSRTNFDLAILSIAVLACVNQGRCTDIRIAYGAVQPLCFRAYGLEELIKGQRISEELIQKAGEESTRLISCSRDLRVSPEYQRSLLKTLTLRALKKVLLNPK